MTEEISLPKETLQLYYDLLVGSMDYGSGFWSTEEVEEIRKLGILLKVPNAMYYKHDRCRHCEHEYSYHPSGPDAVGVTIICHGLKGEPNKYYRTAHYYWESFQKAYPDGWRSLNPKLLPEGTTVNDVVGLNPAATPIQEPHPCECPGFEPREESQSGVSDILEGE
jgi:hypothetical protein